MKSLKRVLSLVIALVLMFSLTGCGEKQSAESAVRGMLEAFKNLDFEEAQKYVNVDEITPANDDESAESAKKIMEAVFGNLDYEIISSEKGEDGTATVKTKITVTDMKPVMTEYFNKAIEFAFANAFADPKPTDEETKQKMEGFLVESISKPDLATVTNEIDIKVNKDDNGNWKVQTDDTFINVMLGGLMDSVAGLSEAFDTAE